METLNIRNIKEMEMENKIMFIFTQKCKFAVIENWENDSEWLLYLYWVINNSYKVMKLHLIVSHK